MRTARQITKLLFVVGGLAVGVSSLVLVRFFTRPLAAAALATLLVLLGGTLVTLRRRVPRRTVLELDLERGVVERIPPEPLGRALTAGTPVLRDVVDALLRAADDDRVIGLVARLGNGKVGPAQAQELRDAVKAFRAGGKQAYAFAETFGEGRSATVAYHLASAFDEIHLQPLGEVHLTGLVARTPFLRRLLDRLAVVPDLDHRREYKSAMYLLTEDRYTAPHREATMGILDSQLAQIVADVAEDRRLDPAAVRTLMDRAPLLPHEAVEAGLVDALSYRDQVYERAEGTKGSLLTVDAYLRRAGRPHRRGTRVALVYGVGGIQRGAPRFDPLSRTSSMGADAVAQALREAVADDEVRAILFRVDSPGGSAVASEVIRREVVRAREAGKPVVVSMGDVAGSGGYWIAVDADRIVAQPGTVTGSIGVVSGKLVTRDAWAKLGVDVDELHVGRNATMFTPDRPFSDSERARLRASLDFLYDEFKARVADGRSLAPDRVEELARGRVWTGADAHRLGLVDELGGLETALAIVRELAGLQPDAPVRLVEYPRRRRIPLPVRRESTEPVEALLRGIAELAEAPVLGSVRMPGF